MSVNTEKEARELIILTCSLGDNGEYYSRELKNDQSLETLEEFSKKLEDAYWKYIAKDA